MVLRHEGPCGYGCGDVRVVHSLMTTQANTADVTQVDGLLVGQEADVLADAGYQGAVRWTRAKVHTLSMLGHLWMLRKRPKRWYECVCRH